jgi:hypothetical protein
MESEDCAFYSINIITIIQESEIKESRKAAAPDGEMEANCPAAPDKNAPSACGEENLIFG